MHFQISHDFDIALDALELAFLSPDLHTKLAGTLPSIESIAATQHLLKDGVLERVWHFQLDIKLPAFAAAYVTKDMCAWDERVVYSLAKHSSTWTIHPNIRPEWQRYFAADGTYEFQSLEAAKSRRVINGHLELNIPMVGQVAERLIVNEVRKTFDAEAEALRNMATLT